jgi:DNA-binding CsgD family transcriptional regulator
MPTEEALLELLDRMNCGAALLDQSGSVVRLNSAAQRCLAKHNSSYRPQAGQELQFVTQALRRLLGGPIEIDRLGQSPRIVQSSGGRPLIVHIRKLAQLGDRPAVLTLVDLDECLEPNVNILRNVFGLTKAEAKLAARLACGETIEDIAEEHGVSISTARVQLKSIFTKTGTSRQAELVSLLTRPATLVQPT